MMLRKKSKTIEKGRRERTSSSMQEFPAYLVLICLLTHKSLQPRTDPACPGGDKYARHRRLSVKIRAGLGFCMQPALWLFPMALQYTHLMDEQAGIKETPAVLRSTRLSAPRGPRKPPTVVSRQDPGDLPSNRIIGDKASRRSAPAQP
ncbi:hypothetical protein K439DRAFT_668387 [Ramaria rubella]|nr:hypothetical protein K439DRAFT_668387 [Ramaria rubella]